jgi:hypothetical protein
MTRLKLKESRSRIAVKTACFIIYALSMIVFAMRHEPWFDESRAWELAKIMDLTNFQEILSNEGHPILWYLFLMPFARLGFPYASISFLSANVMITAAGLLLYYPKNKSMTNLILRGVLLFSPVCFYFYPVISRSYCLSALLIILTTLFFEDRKDHPFRLCITVALLIQTHVFVVGFCFAVCVVSLTEALLLLRKDSKKALRIMMALLIPFISALFYFVEFSRIFEHRILTSGAMGMEGFVFPFFVQLFLLTGTAGMYCLIASLLLTVIYFVLVLYKFELRPAAASIVVFLIACIGYAVICHFYSSDSRGYFLIGYFALFMLWNIYGGKDKTISGAAFMILPLVAAVALTAGMWIYHGKILYDDFNFPFSDAGKTAEAINSLPQDAVIYDYCACPGETVLPYLNEGRVLLTVDGHTVKDDVTFWNERLTEYTGGANPTQFVKDSNPGLKEIYVLYPLTDSPTFPEQYRDTDYISAGYDHEILYESADDVFYYYGLERFGIMKISFDR